MINTLPTVNISRKMRVRVAISLEIFREVTKLQFAINLVNERLTSAHRGRCQSSKAMCARRVASVEIGSMLSAVCVTRKGRTFGGVYLPKVCTTPRNRDAKLSTSRFTSGAFGFLFLS